MWVSKMAPPQGARTCTVLSHLPLRRVVPPPCPSRAAQILCTLTPASFPKSPSCKRWRASLPSPLVLFSAESPTTGSKGSVPGFLSTRCFSPFTVNTRNTHILLPSDRANFKSCVGLTPVALPLLLGVTKRCSQWHSAQACRERTTQINLEHRCGAEKQLYHK